MYILLFVRFNNESHLIKILRDNIRREINILLANDSTS